MTEKIDVKQAASILGVTRMTVQQAIIAGNLPAIKVRRRTLVGLRPTFLIERSDVDAYREYRSRRPARVMWTDDMDAAALELISSCTYQQVGAYLGVSASAVKSRLRHIGGQDVARSGRPMSPFTLPRNGVLLAKSCTKCGELKPAAAYHNRNGVGGTQHPSECRSCSSDARRRYSDKSHAARKALQAHTVENAHKHRQEWTAAEDVQLEDPNKSSYQVALDLGRTLNAVWHRRRNLGLTKKKPEHAPGSWAIEFPATQAEIEAYFRTLGPVSEDRWDWSEDDLAVSA